VALLAGFLRQGVEDGRGGGGVSAQGHQEACVGQVLAADAGIVGATLAVDGFDRIEIAARRVRLQQPVAAGGAA
jgi:hypothetical protein